MTAPIFKNIIDIFTKEKDILSQLLAVSAQKKAHIIAGDVEKLGGILETETALSVEFGQLEENRSALTAGLARRLGQGDGKLTLVQLAGLAEDVRVRDELLALREELTELLKKQKKLNRTNQELISRKNDYINVMLGALIQEEPLDNTYDSTGCVGGRYQSTGLFDQSV